MNKLSTSFILGVMRCARQIVTGSILALYVAQVVGGQAAHFLQSSLGADGCCRVDVCYVETSSAQLHTNGPCDHDAHGPQAHEKRQPVKQPPLRDQGHDSSKCWTCQVLAQAQDTHTEWCAATSSNVSPSVTVALPEVYSSLGCSRFRSRAPPVV